MQPDDDGCVLVLCLSSYMPFLLLLLLLLLITFVFLLLLLLLLFLLLLRFVMPLPQIFTSTPLPSAAMTKPTFRPRPIDVNKRLLIIRSKADLQSVTALLNSLCKTCIT